MAVPFPWPISLPRTSGSDRACDIAEKLTLYRGVMGDLMIRTLLLQDP
jgi:hypothetical protein